MSFAYAGKHEVGGAVPERMFRVPHGRSPELTESEKPLTAQT